MSILLDVVIHFLTTLFVANPVVFGRPSMTWIRDKSHDD